MMAAGTLSRQATAQLASAASVEALRAWIESALPGHQVVYASGADLPRDTDGVKLVMRWKDDGLVVTHQRRDAAEPGRWQFLITKRGPSGSNVRDQRKTAGADNPPTPLAPVGEGVDPPLPSHPADRSDLAKLMALLRQCAERRMACPSNAVIANAIGLGRNERARARAKYLMHRLIDDRQIAVEGRGRCLPRIVTILAKGRACGKATAK